MIRHRAVAFALRILTFVLVVGWLAPAEAQVVAPPQPGAVSGTYAAVDFGPTGLSRGVFTLPSPMRAPEDRGPLLVDVFPTYSPENGLSEWGMGWASTLAITRSGAKGSPGHYCFCDSDELNSPWGRLVPNRPANGTFYPQGLQIAARFIHAGATMGASLGISMAKNLAKFL